MDLAETGDCERMGVNGANTLFIDGQFCIPIGLHGAFLPDDDSNFEINSNVDCLKTDDWGIIFCLNNPGMEVAEGQNQIIYYSNDVEPTLEVDDNFLNSQFKLVDYNGIPMKTLTLDNELLNVDPFLDNTSDLDQLSENFGLTGCQYVLQLNDNIHKEDTSDSFLCNQMQSRNVDEKPTDEQLGFIDILQLTGANLQTVNLNVEKLIKSEHDPSLKTTDVNKNNQKPNQQKALNNLLHKKLTIGRTSTGQRLVGKIIHVGKKGDVQNKTMSDTTRNQMPSTVIMDADKFTEMKILTENRDKSSLLRDPQCIDIDLIDKPKEISSNCINGNITEYISRLLTSLMQMESVSKKLKRKNLLVIIIEKNIYNGKVNMNMFEINGHLELQLGTETGVDQCKWMFKMHKGPINNKHGIWCPRKSRRKFQETMKLTTTIELSNGIIKSTKVNLNIHQEKCSLCMEEFKTLYKLKTHLKLVHHMMDNHFICQVCDELGENILTEPEHQVSKKQSFDCNKCNRQYITKGNLSKHMLSSHDPENWKLACKICGEEYSRISLWRKHILTHTGMKLDDKEYFSCNEQCHSKPNDPKSCYVCKVCNRTFSRYSNLQRHSEIHGRKNSMAIYSCSMCGCTYNYISSLTRHIVQNHITVP